MIRVSNPLDRESVDQYAITVTATDNQSPPQTGITSVRIAITDVNDNRPAFSSDAYKFSVSEDAVMSTLVGNVVAVDQDAGNNSKLSYSIQSGNDSESVGFWIMVLILVLISVPGIRTHNIRFREYTKKLPYSII